MKTSRRTRTTDLDTIPSEPLYERLRDVHRLRLDLVLNDFVCAVTSGEITVLSDGNLDFRRLALGIVLAPLPNTAFPRLRELTHRLLGIRIGRSTLIRGRLNLSGPPGCTSRLTIGSHCFFTTPLHVDLNSDVVIGNYVTIGHDVVIVTSAHEIGGPNRRCGKQVPPPIRIGDGCWIGARVLLLPGVVLGEGSIIAAGAVVYSNVTPHTIVGGVPARLIRRLIV